jgi:hypothetical protein
MYGDCVNCGYDQNFVGHRTRDNLCPYHMLHPQTPVGCESQEGTESPEDVGTNFLKETMSQAETN